jgi:pilus assembly protein CpaE
LEEVARVVLGLEAHDVAEEVMHFLDRNGRTRVVATAADERQLIEAIRQLEPDVVVASPGLGGSAANLDGSILLAVDTSESIQSLRGAIRAGARGFFLWPEERAALAQAAGRAKLSTDLAGSKRAPVVAVWASRGGAGATFVATHLAAALKRRGQNCVLLDLDLFFAEVSSALGVPDEPSARTIADLLPLVGEISDTHLDEILWVHPQGFRVLLAPNEADAAARVRPSDLRSTIAAVQKASDVVVLHLPRALDPVMRTGLEIADRILIVLTLDVLSFRDAKRAFEAMAGLETRSDFVVNRAARAEIVPGDVERVFGRPSLAVIPSARGVPAAQDRGRLMAPRGRVGRAIDRLARQMVHESRR